MDLCSSNLHVASRGTVRVLYYWSPPLGPRVHRDLGQDAAATSTFQACISPTEVAPDLDELPSETSK